MVIRFYEGRGERSTTPPPPQILDEACFLPRDGHFDTTVFGWACLGRFGATFRPQGGCMWDRLPQTVGDPASC